MQPHRSIFAALVATTRRITSSELHPGRGRTSWSVAVRRDGRRPANPLDVLVGPDDLNRPTPSLRCVAGAGLRRRVALAGTRGTLLHAGPLGCAALLALAPGSGPLRGVVVVLVAV